MSATGYSAKEGKKNYLNNGTSIRSWLTTLDHKRIAILYMVGVMVFFAIGALGATMIRLELIRNDGFILEHDTYNRMFSMHGIVMVFFVIIPSIPAILGNFCIPLMIGAKDVAFPRLNLLSWYMYITGGILAAIAIFSGGVDTGWTFYTPYSSQFSNSNVSLALFAAFFAGFSSIFTGLNFIVTIHKMRAPGLTWFRLPLFIWAQYATSIIMVLATPVIAITLMCIVVERTLGLGIFDPTKGGDPVLMQHMFWFYSHPAVYIMIVPSMGVISEVVSCFSRRKIFGYPFIAFSSLAIAVFGFVVWGHHMFLTGQSAYLGYIFSILSFMVAIPSAVKVFNWAATMYKGHIWFTAPMLFALGFIGLFVVGGLTGLFLSSMGTDLHLHDTYFVVAHFHYVMVGGSIMGFLAGIHFWWPKIFGRMYPENWAKTAAILVFLGFNLTFFPQFILGYQGMPRRYHYYSAQYLPLNVLSSAGASVLAVGYIIPLFYLIWSLKYGRRVTSNPWRAVGLEWMTSSPPPTENFDHKPVVTWEAYDYHYSEIDDLPEEPESMMYLPEDEDAHTHDKPEAAVGGEV